MSKKVPPPVRRALQEASYNQANDIIGPTDPSWGRRGTGRTTRMLAEVAQLVAAGRHVTIVAATQAHRQTLVDLLPPAARGAAVITVHDPEFVWLPQPRIRGLNTTVFIDHYTAEVEAEYLRRRLAVVLGLAHLYDR